jgi:hypothetical protein
MKRVIEITLFLVFLYLYIPVIGQVSVIGNLFREKPAKPGETYSGTIEIANIGKEAAEAIVYQTDYLFYADGTNQYGDPGFLPRSNAKWIEFSPKQFVIPAEDKAVINYTVHVPAVDSLAGTYWSLLMIEPVNKSTPELTKGQIGIISIVRYGIQLITHIGDTGSRNIRFFDTGLTKEESSMFFQVSLENNGQRMLTPLPWIELWDQNGKEVGKFEGVQARIYPGTSVKQKIDISSVKPGSYKALLVADAGGEDVFGMNLTLQILPPEQK